MEKTQIKPSSGKARRILIAFSSLVLFVAAVFAVSSLTFHKNKKIAPAATTATVQISAAGFEPETLSVKQGTKVTWVNKDQALHQIAANPFPKNGTGPRSVRSEILNNLQTYTYTANTAGSFSYHDQLHPTINGTLVVKSK